MNIFITSNNFIQSCGMNRECDSLDDYPKCKVHTIILMTPYCYGVMVFLRNTKIDYVIYFKYKLIYDSLNVTNNELEPMKLYQRAADIFDYFQDVGPLLVCKIMLNKVFENLSNISSVRL